MKAPMCMHLSVSKFPHLLNHTWYIAIYISRCHAKLSTSHHFGGKSQSGTVYPPNRYLFTILVNEYFLKSYTNEFIWVNCEKMLDLNSLNMKIWGNTSHSYFYPQNWQVGWMKELSITKKISKFHLNSVNGGHSFFSENQIKFFYYKLQPSR